MQIRHNVKRALRHVLNLAQQHLLMVVVRVKKHAPIFAAVIVHQLVVISVKDFVRIILKTDVAVASILIFYGCKKDGTSLALQKAMEKTSEIKKLGKGSWRWAVYCDGVYFEGSVETSKSNAKAAIKSVDCPPTDEGGEESTSTVFIWFEEEDYLQVSLEASIVNTIFTVLQSKSSSANASRAERLRVVAFPFSSV